MTEVKKSPVVYEDNQGEIFLAKDRQVGMHTEHIDISHHFLSDMVEDKDIDINYIMSEEKLVNIMKNNISEADNVKHTNRITEGELC